MTARTPKSPSGRGRQDETEGAGSVPCSTPSAFVDADLDELDALVTAAERALGIELSGGGWSALADALGIEEDDWSPGDECEKRAQRFESGSGGVEAQAKGNPRTSNEPGSQRPPSAGNRPARNAPSGVCAGSAKLGADPGPLPDSLLPRLAPPVHFEPLPHLHATTAAVSRSKLVDATWHRRWDLDSTGGVGMSTYCEDCLDWHTAASREELVELLDLQHPPEPDPDEYHERKRDLR